MKKTLTKAICLSLILAGVTFTSFAQIRFGARAGLNLANISGDGDDDNAMKLGLHLGGMVHVPINGRLCFQPEILFSMKGTQSKEESNFKLHLNYIDLPLMLNYRIDNGVYFEGGLTVGGLISAKAKFDGDSEDVKDFFKGSDVGGAIGAGYRTHNGFSVGLRYQAGISNIADDADFTSHNNVLMLTLGFLFGHETD